MKVAARRESLLTEVAGTWQQKALPITSTQIAVFGNTYHATLLGKESGFSKQYLRLLVSEIRVAGNEVRMTGSKVNFLHAVLEKKMGTMKVPILGIGWLPNPVSNQQAGADQIITSPTSLSTSPPD